MADLPTDTYHLSGVLLHFLDCDPAAKYCLVEALVSPGNGPPLHRHPDDDEAFYVLSGTFRFVIGLETRTAKAGAFVSIPRGEVHTFRNIAQAPARMLIINVPGTAHRGFFSQAGEPLPPGTKHLPPLSGPPDVSRLFEAGQRNGIEFLLLDRRNRC